MEEYKRYRYTGPVTSFGKILTENWTGETFAVSEKKARSNLIFQYKKYYGKVTAQTKIELPNKLTEV